MPLKGNSVNDGFKGGIRQFFFFVFYKTSKTAPQRYNVKSVHFTSVKNLGNIQQKHKKPIGYSTMIFFIKRLGSSQLSNPFKNQ
jgi:hypothetical protein